MTGTRFSRQFGKLFYRDRPIPRSISVLATPIGVFSYRQEVFRSSGYFGWVPADGADWYSKIKGSRNQVFSGGYWYKGAPEARKPGTPAHWVWIRFRGDGYWIDPAGLEYFIVSKDHDAADKNGD